MGDTGGVVKNEEGATGVGDMGMGETDKGADKGGDDAEENGTRSSCSIVFLQAIAILSISLSVLPLYLTTKSRGSPHVRMLYN